MANTFDFSTLIAILPQLGIFLLGAVVLLLDLFWKDEERSPFAYVTAAGLVIVGVISAIWARPGAAGQLVFGGMLRWDWMSFLFTMLFLFGGAVTSLFIRDYPQTGKQGEFYVLMLTSILGMSLMAGAADLIMLFLAIETTSIPLYVLAGFLRKDDASSEAGFKYLIYGAVTSAVMLYGFSMLFGMTGTTQIYEMNQILSNVVPGVGSLLIILMVLVGLGFKISAFPFHFWAPDVYQGAPTPVAGFLSTASKAAGFAVILRFMPLVFYDLRFVWSIVIAVMSIASMTFGNLQALRQKNIKRLLAYSSIAQAGYMLIGVAAVSGLGFISTAMYVMAYVLTNLTAFGIISIVGRVVGSDEVQAYAGLSRRSPSLALAMLVAFLSLAGIPPFAGFAAKIFLFSSAVQVMQYPWLFTLAIFGILNAIIALYYYLVVMKVVYLGRSENDTEPLPVAESTRTSVLVFTAAIVVLGIAISPWFTAAQTAIQSIFN